MNVGVIFSFGFLSIAWGLSFLFVAKVVHAFGWAAAVSFRALIAAAALAIIVMVTGRKLSFSGRLWPLIVVGATSVSGQSIGLSYATPIIGTAMAAILVATIPLFSMLIGRIFGHERIFGVRLLGLICGLCGVILLVGFPSVGMSASFAVGCAASTFSSLCAAFGSHYASRQKNIGPLELTIGSFVTGGLITLPLVALVPIPRSATTTDFVYLCVLAIIMSSFAYVTFFALVAKVGATKAISVEFLVTAVAVAVGTLLLNERLSVVQATGAVLVVSGFLLVLDLLPQSIRKSYSRIRRS
ncbi:EamA-like transporter family protein [Paraburkholderia sp. BL27I4N3]|uniref:DMT family transporter n=1 Tax=Paraburkholderia sp. BL27I4N3 TaxID=1938805 RepID=UPI000E247E14|nr:DMT family transporter [Paraburkholderia sp. BL27I4N3]REE18128.1 EamA-like transporter family protein [Paraburkholderia sp. BL27I4N3]